MALPLSDDLLALAREQHGLLTTRQLSRAGLDSGARIRRVAVGALAHETDGVFAVSGLRDRFTHLAALQMVIPGLVAERRTAAAVWDLDGFRDFDGLELAWPPGSRTRRSLIARAAKLPPAVVTVHRQLRVTTAAWTLREIDADLDTMELAVESALRKGLTTEVELWHVLGANGVMARRPLGIPPTESYAETRFLQRVVRHLGLEEPERQSPIRVRGRRAPYRRDFVFRRDGRELDVEIDGLVVHGTPEARAHDLLRDERIREEGCAVVRFAAGRVEANRSGVCRALMAALRELG
ncbi:MAG: endonuclease domain-containing protein [Acidimicrobiales bacterium]